MTEARYDVLGIGNAIFDILGHVNDDVLTADMEVLLKQWAQIEKKAAKGQRPTLLSREPELAVRVGRTHPCRRNRAMRAARRLGRPDHSAKRGGRDMRAES